MENKTSKITSCKCKFKKTWILEHDCKFYPYQLIDQYTEDGKINRTYKKLTSCPVCGKKIKVGE